MDMTYITCLLKEGFGFKDSTVLQVGVSPLPLHVDVYSRGATFNFAPSVCLSVCLSDSWPRR